MFEHDKEQLFNPQPHPSKCQSIFAVNFWRIIYAAQIFLLKFSYLNFASYFLYLSRLNPTLEIIVGALINDCNQHLHITYHGVNVDFTKIKGETNAYMLVKDM